MVEFFMNRLRRGVIAAIGLLTYAVGIYFQLKADIGVAPWNALNEGLSSKFNITFGTASIIVALVVIAVDLLMRERLGIGTFLDAFLVGIGTVICVFGTGIIMDFVFKIMKFEPRSVVHEGFFETAAEFYKAISNGNK